MTGSQLLTNLKTVAALETKLNTALAAEGLEKASTGGAGGAFTVIMTTATQKITDLEKIENRTNTHIYCMND